MAEVKQHRSKDDAWLVLKGKVQNTLSIINLFAYMHFFLAHYLARSSTCLLADSLTHHVCLVSAFVFADKAHDILLHSS